MPGARTLRDSEVLPEAARVMISPHLTHRLPELYDPPERCPPERCGFVRPPMTICRAVAVPGDAQDLCAMANMRMALAVLLSRFNVGLVDGARHDRSHAAVNVPHGAVPALLSPRHGAPVAANVLRRPGNVFGMVEPAAATWRKV